MCITDFSDAQNRVSCNLANLNTHTYDGMSSVKFGKDLGNGLQNPVKLPFKAHSVRGWFWTFQNITFLRVSKM